MHVSPLEEYALRCAMQLAKVQPEEPIPASKIAESEGISVEYVSKIMYLFRRAGIVESTRGVQGGFRLTRNPGKLAVKEIFDSLQHNKKKFEEDFCNQFAGQASQCVHLNCCSIRPVWQILSSYFDEMLTGLTLADLMAPSADIVRGRIQELALQKAQALKVGGVI
ncbi:MAG: Rrf2 family transcriptional regulator [Bdellovibrionota bacterium]